MMYFNPRTCTFYSKLIHGNSLPKGCVPVDHANYSRILENQGNGMEISSDEDGNPVLIKSSENLVDVVSIEKTWRDGELRRSDYELYKVQDSDPKAAGSVSDWRIYRKALRSWPENKDFPKQEFRPKAPGAE